MEHGVIIRLKLFRESCKVKWHNYNPTNKFFWADYGIEHGLSAYFRTRMELKLDRMSYM